jgi:cell division protein FtsB
MRRANEQLGTEVGGLKQRVEMPEQENRRLTQANEVVRRDIVEVFVAPRERAALGLAETKDRTSRVESDVAGLRAAMADVSAKVKEVRREVADLKAHLSVYCPKLKRDFTNLARELANMKEEAKRVWMTKHFPRSVKKGGPFDVPDGIIAHLTRECGDVIDVTSGSFEKEIHGANPHSGVYNNDPNFTAKNAVYLERSSYFASALR